MSEASKKNRTAQQEVSSISALTSLQSAEESVLEILKIAIQTTDELQQVPSCNTMLLQNLSSSFVKNVSSIQDEIHKATCVHLETVSSSDDVYVLEKRLEIARNLESLKASEPKI
jgi:hypothetical protein